MIGKISISAAILVAATAGLSLSAAPAMATGAGDRSTAADKCEGVRPANGTISNFNTHPFNVASPCTLARVHLSAQWVDMGCVSGGTNRDYKIELTMGPTSASTMFPAGNTGAAGCPGAGPMAGDVDFSVAPGAYQLRVSTNGAGSGRKLKYTGTVQVSP